MFDIFKKILNIEEEKKVDREEQKAKNKPEVLEELEDEVVYIEDKIDFNEFSKNIDANSVPKNSTIIELYNKRQDELKKRREEKSKLSNETDIPDDVSEVTPENALNYIEDKIDNFDNVQPVQESNEQQTTIEEVSMDNVLDILDEKLENAEINKISDDELDEILEEAEYQDFDGNSLEQVTEEDIEKALHYFEEKAEEHEEERKQEDNLEIKSEIEDAFHYFEAKAEEHEKEIQEEKQDEIESHIDEILEEAEYQDFDGNPVEEIIKSESAEEFSITEIENMPDFSEPEVPQKQEQPEQTEEQKTKGLFGFSFAGLKDAVSKTSEFFSSNIFSIAAGKTAIDDDMLDDMEEKFIRADIGVKTTVYIIERLRERQNQIKPDELNQYLKNEFKEITKSAGRNEIDLRIGQLNTFLITGVNGAGKTTLIGKLAYKYNLQGKKVLVAAGDTFRAAAEEQLEIWASRAGADIVRQDGADPAAVVFDAIKKAQTENYDILLIDTAGRLHNKFNLMEELRKIKKVIDREAPESLVESLLVLDATTGQNGLKQAEVFKESVDLTGVGLTKLDGTAKGGVILGIAQELNLPVKLIGVGEKMEDLKEFNTDDFIEALF
jgi:fused signal recognition particle receptor